MDYIQQLNAFELWLETNYLPGDSQLIWYKLFMLFNRSGWAEWVTVRNEKLMALADINSETTFIRARDKLLEANLFIYQKGKKGSPNKYKITILYTPKNETNTEYKSNDINCTTNNGVNAELIRGENDSQNGVNTTYIYKLNKTKPNDTKIKEKDKKEKSPLIPFYEILQNETEAFKTIVLEFVDHKNSLKSPFLSQMQFEKWLKKLKRMGDEQTQIAIVEQSIVEGWQGIFQIKENRGDKNGVNSGNSVVFTAKGANGANTENDSFRRLDEAMRKNNARWEKKD